MKIARSFLNRFVVTASMLALAACGGGGGGGGGDDPPSGGGAANTLFAADSLNGVVASVATLTPAPGSTLSARTITGIPGLGSNISFDAGRNQLYVGSVGSVRVYAGASTASGMAVPARTIVPTGVEADDNAGVFLDKSRDRLYFCIRRGFDTFMLVFDGASTLSGTVTPTRTIALPEDVRAFAVDTTRSILYTAGSSIGITVYPSLDTSSGQVIPTGSIFRVSVSGLALDSGRDRLYVADPFDGVHVIANASTATSADFAPVVAFPNPASVAIDPAHDRLYVGAYEHAYLFEGASTIASSGSSSVAATTASGFYFGGFALP